MHEPRPDPVIQDGVEVYHIERIMDSEYRRNKLHYLVHWRGYSEDDRTWEPIDNITGGIQNKHLREYHLAHKDRPGFEEVIQPRGTRSRPGGTVMGTSGSPEPPK